MKHYTATETLEKAIECANSYAVQVEFYTHEKLFYNIGRDESGKVTIFLSDKIPQALAAFYIVGLLLYAQSRQWVDMDNKAVKRLKVTFARIRKRHKKVETA